MSVFSLCAAGTTLIAGAAFADGYDLVLTFNGIDKGQSMSYSYVAGDAWDAPVRTDGHAAFAGRLKFNGGSFHAFCAEIDVNMQGGDVAVYKRTEIEYIPSTDAMEAKAATMRTHYNQNYSGLTTNAEYAAFAMVVWEIAQEDWDASSLNQLDLHLGAVQFTVLSTEAEAAANSMLSRLTYGGSMSLWGWTNPEYQDIITVVPGPSIALAGLIGLAGIRRRRRN
jgi:hypothetical protein